MKNSARISVLKIEAETGARMLVFSARYHVPSSEALLKTVHAVVCLLDILTEKFVDSPLFMLVLPFASQHQPSTRGDHVHLRSDGAALG